MILERTDMNGNAVWLGIMGLIWGSFLLIFSCAQSPQLAFAEQHLTDLPKPALLPTAEKRDIRCFLSEEKVLTMAALDSDMVSRHGLNYVAIYYSFDGGEKINLTLLYPYVQGHVLPFPTVYIFGDIKNAKQPSDVQVYSDKTGDGICKGITWEPSEDTTK